MLRKFQFFDKDEVRVQNETKTEEINPFKEFHSSCSCSGRGHLILGDGNGVIRIYDREFNCVKFQAHDISIVCLFQLKRTNLLISLGTDNDTTPASIKFWKLDKFEDDGSPLQLKKLKVFSEKFPDVPITCLSVLEDLSELAIGLGNGAVFLFSGDLLRDRTPRHTLLKQEGPCITGVHFREDVDNPSLWVISTKQIISFFIKKRSPNSMVVLDEEQGAEMHCSVVNDDRQLVVAHTSDIKFYEADDIGPCSGLEGTKKLLLYYKNYFIVISEEAKDMVSEQCLVTIYDWRDRRNKFIAYQGRVETVCEVMAEWGRLFIVCQDQQRHAYSLTEQDLPTKMRVLFNKYLYQIAISLARSQGCDDAYVMEIYQLYGDHLYKKGDFDGAITQFIETIGQIEPSYVIRNFLDAPRIHNLTRYLQALHMRKLASADHTTLLLNCYTKLKDVGKLNEFILSDSDLQFDVDTAIRVFRQANYFEHALYLAHRHQRHEYYLKILLDDLKNYAGSIAYIASLDFEQCELYLKVHGARLMSSVAEATTRLLQRLCTNYIRDTPPTPVFTIFPTESAPVTVPSSGLGSVTGSDISTGTTTVTGLTKSAIVATTISIPISSPRIKAKADDFIHIFVNNSSNLISFLEYVCLQEADIPSMILVHNTLLEMYLRLGPISSSSTSGTSINISTSPILEETLLFETKINALLRAIPIRYDAETALNLCKAHRFEKGIVFLYEKLAMFGEIVQHYIDHQDSAKVIESCRKHGPSEPSLWLQALTYFANQPSGDCVAEIRQILERIDTPAQTQPTANGGSSMPPLMVIQILSRNSQIPLGAVKDYVIKNFNRQQQDIFSDRSIIRRYQEETKKMRLETEELKNCAKTFNAPKCHMCTSAIELPAVHFLCGHSFHQRCLGDTDKECPNCCVDFKKVLDMKESMRQSVSRPEKFFKQLDSSTDGFATVAEYYGRGMFSSVGINSASQTRLASSGSPTKGR